MIALLILMNSAAVPAVSGSVVVPHQAPAERFPEPVRKLVESAISSGDAAGVAAVVRHAKRAFPAAAAEIGALHQAFLETRSAQKERAEQARREALAQSSMVEHWDGNIEVGASRATGSADSLGLFGALAAQRQGLDWSHRLAARAEVRETNGKRTMERLFAEWQPRRKVGEHLYGFGLTQFDRDPFRGFDGRYTFGLGAGYSVVDEADLKLDVEGGPSLRHEDSRSVEDVTTFGGRASFDLRWKLTPTLELKQNGSLFLDEHKGSGRAATAIDAALFGPLRLRLSYELRFEQDKLTDRSALDTTSRATFVYGF